jgi:hypothetical protein
MVLFVNAKMVTMVIIALATTMNVPVNLVSEARVKMV